MFPRGTRTGPAKGAGEAGRKATAETAIGKNRRHTSCHLSAAFWEGVAILATPCSFACLMPETLLLRESSSGTVMSHMLGSGESHAPRSLKKIKTGARWV